MSFAWDAPPRVIGHRGAPVEAPENTLASFAAAVASGAEGIELDARLTRDGHVVVAHDAECGRTIAGDGIIERLDLADVQRRDAGSWFHPGFAAQRTPTLAQVLRAVPARIALDVELKADAENATGLPEAVHAVVKECAALDRVLVTSFDPDLALDYARLAMRPAGVITAFPPEPEDLDTWQGLDFVAVARDVALAEALPTLRAAKKTVLVWTVDDLGEAQRLIARGASGIITDSPATLRSLAAPRPRTGAPGA